MSTIPITAATATVLEAERRWLCRVFDSNIVLTLADDGSGTFVGMHAGGFLTVGRFQITDGVLLSEQGEPDAR